MANDTGSKRREPSCAVNHDAIRYELAKNNDPKVVDCPGGCGWTMRAMVGVEPRKRQDVAVSLLRELVDIDWCIGYELTEDMEARIDDIRTRAAMLLDRQGVRDSETLDDGA